MRRLKKKKINAEEVKKWSGESCLAGVALQGTTANQIRWAECNLSFTLRPRIPRNCATLKKSKLVNGNKIPSPLRKISKRENETSRCREGGTVGVEKLEASLPQAFPERIDCLRSSQMPLFQLCYRHPLPLSLSLTYG